MARRRELSNLQQADTNMTSMIDVVFLLISFFTLVMNFSQAEQHEEIALPKSEIAQPPDAAPPEMITLQIGADHRVFLGAKVCGIESDDYAATSLAAAVREEVDAACQAGLAHESDPKFVADLLGWMFSRCEEGVTLGNEWICHDPAVQLDHANDPFDAFTHPTHNISLRDFIDMMTFIQGKEWAEKVPTDLPILLIAGDQDPVGCFGEGVYQCANWLADTGHQVTTHLWSGYRHEIHNYVDIKDEVAEFIIDWLYETY